MDINWSCKNFIDLTPNELYEILKLRIAVFVVEQNCVFQDCDDKDQGSWHLMGWNGKELVAYARLLPPALGYPQPSIGRVITAASQRGMGAGKKLMEIAIQKTHELFGKQPITIGAQLYLKEFYASFGFIQSGDIYLEDGIEHIKMARQ